jgi:hypothetical protein
VLCAHTDEECRTAHPEYPLCCVSSAPDYEKCLNFGKDEKQDVQRSTCGTA